MDSLAAEKGRREGERIKGLPTVLLRKLPNGPITERGHRRRRFDGLSDKLAMGTYSVWGFLETSVFNRQLYVGLRANKRNMINIRCGHPWYRGDSWIGDIEDIIQRNIPCRVSVLNFVESQTHIRLIKDRHFQEKNVTQHFVHHLGSLLGLWSRVRGLARESQGTRREGIMKAKGEEFQEVVKGTKCHKEAS